MEAIRYSLKRVTREKNADLDGSKLLGNPVVPSDFIRRNKIRASHYFVAQINCEEASAESPFPATGFLYFFLDVNTLKPKVIYEGHEPEELIEDVNASFDPTSCGDPTCLRMSFAEEGGKGSLLFGEVDPDIGLEGDTDTSGKLTLLQIDALSLPEGEQRPLIFGNYGMGDGYWVFLIREEDLMKGDYSKVEFIEVGY